MTLFDPEPLTVAQPEPLSRTQKLTLRRQADIAAGRHPVTKLRLLDPEWGFTCGTCAHLTEVRFAKTYVKCDLRNTGSEATDIRKSWPACARYRIDGGAAA